MAKPFPHLMDAHMELIAAQHIFFTATAAAGTRINISPRPTDCFRVISPTLVAYRDLTGSGSETAAHLRADGRMTIMFCTFDGAPLILRLYGTGRSLPLGSDAYREALEAHFAGEAPLGTRQIVMLDITYVQTSCGYGVPLFDFRGDWQNLVRWAEHQGEDGLKDYRTRKNRVSLDGLPSLVD
jgi:Pyridoxamine 5'-phosphate oxidase